MIFFREGITKCSNEVCNKFTNVRQHNNYLLNHIGYMFRPVNRSSSGHQQNKSNVLLKNWDPNFLYSCRQMQNLVLDKMWQIYYLVKNN